MLDRSESALRVVVRSKFYRSAFLALLIAGIGLSAATPQLTLFLVRELELSGHIAHTLIDLAQLAIQQGDLEAATAHFGECLELVVERSDRWGGAHCLAGFAPAGGRVVLRHQPGRPGGGLPGRPVVGPEP